MIRVLICDGDGTLRFPSPPPDVLRMLALLESRGVELAVATNNRNRAAVVDAFRLAGIAVPRAIVTRSDMPKAKPYPGFVERIGELTGASRAEMAFLGDDDATDGLCAINAHVLPLAAQYSLAPKARRYGLSLDSPEDVARYLSTLGQQPSPYFGWICSAACGDTGRAIDVRALFGRMSDLGLRPSLERILKHGADVQWGRISAKALVFDRLITELYLDGISLGIDYVTVYPGHNPGNTNQLLQGYSSQISRIFNDRWIADLLVRHSPAPKSQLQGAARKITSQLGTIHVNPKYNYRLVGKSVLVLDDFTTFGYSMETARRMLIKAGANNVVGIAIAKFGQSHSVLKINRDWDPFRPEAFAEDDIEVVMHHGLQRPEPDIYFGEIVWPSYTGLSSPSQSTK